MAAGSGILGHTLGVGPADTITVPPEFAGSKLIGHNSEFVSTAHVETESKVEGWHWDKRFWASNEFENSEAFVNAIWDPTHSGLAKTFFQSGIGDNRDIEYLGLDLVLSSGMNEADITKVWAPMLQHGHYYDFNMGRYVFSDDSEVSYASFSGVTFGLNMPVSRSFNKIELTKFLKPGVPVAVCQYKWDHADGQYTPSIQFRKRSEFTGVRDEDNIRLSTYNTSKEAIIFENIDRDEPEFVVVYTGVVPAGQGTQYPAVVLNNQFVQQIGNGAVPNNLDLLGITLGVDNEQVRTTWSPLDSTQPTNVYTWLTPSGIVTQWETIPIDTAPSGLQVGVDYDLGVVRFGDTTVTGQVIPSGGSFVGANYWRTVEVEYEPEDTSDFFTGVETSVNPIYRRSGQGFVFLSPAEEDPVSITLTAQLPLISANLYGPLYVGTSYAAVIATVKGRKEQLLEGLSVDFEITSVVTAGHFTGDSTTATATTDLNGKAKTYFFPPLSVDDISENIPAADISVNNAPVTPSGATQTTTFRTDELLIDASVDDIFLYEVTTDDPLVGFFDPGVAADSASQVDEYYRTFFNTEDIWGRTGQTASGVTNSLAISWEDQRRLVWNLSRPLIFGANAGKGKRKIVSILDADALNPHTYQAGAIIPLQPVFLENVAPAEFDITYDTSNVNIPLPSGFLNSYQIVAPTIVTLQASVYNTKLNRRIFSNEISIKLDIPPYAKGLWEVDLLNGLAEEEISSLITSAMVDKKVPLGWRIKSSNITLAAALDGVTFADTNPPYNLYLWDTASGIYLGHQFEVIA